MSQFYDRGWSKSDKTIIEKMKWIAKKFIEE